MSCPWQFSGRLLQSRYLVFSCIPRSLVHQQPRSRFPPEVLYSPSTSLAQGACLKVIAMNTFQLFCALCSLSHGVFGVAIPGQFTQAPLPPSKPDTKTSVPFYATKAILAVTAVGDEDEKYIELPLRQRMPPGMPSTCFSIARDNSNASQAPNFRIVWTARGLWP